MGNAIGVYATAVLDHPLPWTKMRQVYALLGLVKRWGVERVEAACRKALDAEAIHVPLIGRMLERGTEHHQEKAATPAAATVVTARFARDPSHFAVEHPERRASGFGGDRKRTAHDVPQAGSRGDAA